MKCEYENAVHKLLDLADIIKNRGGKSLWKNGILDKRVKDRLLTIGKILNTTKSDTGEKQCNLPDVSNLFDLRELECKLDEALGKETRETLTEWLRQQRQ